MERLKFLYHLLVFFSGIVVMVLAIYIAKLNLSGGIIGLDFGAQVAVITFNIALFIVAIEALR